MPAPDPEITRLILQFLLEYGLLKSTQVLQMESGLMFNGLENPDAFLADITNGRWGAVIGTLSTIQLPKSLQQDIYEQAILELLEEGERNMANTLLKDVTVVQQLQSDAPRRYQRLDAYIRKSTSTDPESLYKVPKDKRRLELAQACAPHLKQVPQSRLLALIQQALKWQNHIGLIASGEKVDLVEGVSKKADDDAVEKYPSILGKTIEFGKKASPSAVAFSPDGQYMVSGSQAGFVEVWDYNAGTLRRDLEYQAKDELMLHDNPVIALTFNSDSTLLVTGDAAGILKAWTIADGKCVRRMEAHPDGITSAVFHKDGTQVLTASYDGSARIHGLRSGKTLKEMRGHQSHVNVALFSHDHNKVVTASSDSKVRVFDSRSCACIAQFVPPVPPHLNSAAEISAIGLMLRPRKEGDKEDAVYVITKTSTLYLMNLQGQQLKQYNTGKREGGDFVCGVASPKGKWVFCVAEDGNLYCFDTETEEGKLEHILDLEVDKDVIALAAHPRLGFLCSACMDGSMKMMLP
jgi:WD40 repeat-containing protein SMU1